MGPRCSFKSAGIAAALLAGMFLSRAALGQSNTGIIRGTVTDPSGAQVAGAAVSATSAPGQIVSATTNAQGAYEFRGLAPGSYEVKASAPSFQDFDKPSVAVTAGSAQTIDIPLLIQIQHQQVQVSDTAPTLEVSPDKNAGAVSLKGSDLDALSNDPDQLAQDLQTLAGPATGPNGGQVYVNGFTAGQLPPKSSIREIRVNQNPFAAEFDSVGFGRIEILTKPGTNQLHGDAFLWANDQPLNTWSRFVRGPHLGYYTLQEGGDLSGSLGKKTSFSAFYNRRFINQLELGAILDPNTFVSTSGAFGVTNPRLRNSLGGTVDYQLTANNTLTVLYQYWQNSEQSDGISSFSLLDQAYDSASHEHQFQITDSQIINQSAVNETRFQYLRDYSANTPLSLAVAYSAPSAVNGGGNTSGRTSDTQNHFELQNYTTMVKGHHTIKFGARLRDATDSNYSLSNANGSFSFATGGAYVAAELALKQGMPIPVADYPASFTLGTGSPTVSANLFDGGIFVQDDFQWRPNVTFSGGFRFETQTGMPDHADYAPRFAIAWGVGKTKTGTPRAVIRGGWGIFYNRFPESSVLNSRRLDEGNQISYTVQNPNFFPLVPTPAELVGSATAPPLKTVAPIAPNLHAPYNMQTAVTLEQQLFHGMSLTVNYINARGVHQFYTANVDTPLPGTFNPADPSSAQYPLDYAEYVDQYRSGGVFKQNELIVNFNGKAAKFLSLYSYYVLNYASGTTGGLLSDFYQPQLDYGRASFDVHNRVFVGGNFTLKYAIQISPFIVYASGSPFNITSGQNLFGTSAGGANARPSFTTLPPNPSSDPNNPQTVFATPWGNLFDGLPAAGESTIPINLGTGPHTFYSNISISKAFRFGPPPEAPAASASDASATPAPAAPAKKTPGRYSLSVGVYARNAFNQTNYGTPVGALGSADLLKPVSTLFGGPANRTIYLSASFTF